MGTDREITEIHDFWGGSQGEALGPQSVSNHTSPNTKHTCELAAVVQDQAGECHALEHLDVAWGNGVDRWNLEERRMKRNEEGSWKGSQQG